MFEADYCSFCGKRRDEVAKLVSGPAKAGICNECHDLMRDMMPPPPPGPTPEERAELNRQVDEYLAQNPISKD
jgi:ATP-dependent protease Clp ATPase subunit